MKNLKLITFSLFTVFLLLLSIPNINVQAAIDNKSLPEVVFVGVDHSPLVVGDKETFYITSKNADKVQYRIFLYTENTNKWQELTNGYTSAVDAKAPYIISPSTPFQLGKYKLNIKVKRANQIGANSDKDGDYDTIFTSYLNCVDKDDSNRVYSDGPMDIEKDNYSLGEKVTINGIKNLSGMKGPYTYKLHIYDVNNNEWITDSGSFRNKPEWTPTHAGTYVLDVWGISSNSTLWPRIKLDPKEKLYESWKLKVINVTDITSVTPINIETNVGVAPNLPNKVTARLGDNTSKDFEVVWNNTNPSIFSVPGTTNISGSIKGFNYPVTATVTVKSLDIVSIVPVTLGTAIGVPPNLPSKVSVTLKDGSTSSIDVIWSYVDPSLYSLWGSFEASGMLIGTSIPIKATIYVKSGNSSNIPTQPNTNTQPNNGSYKIVIDPGHGGYDSGAVGPNKTKEKDINLSIALKLGTLLEKQNVQILYTRKTDKVSWPSNEVDDLTARNKISNDYKPNYYVSIHCNSAGSTISGIETYTYSFGGKSEKLAKDVQAELIKSTGLNNRGVKLGNFQVIRETDAPSILTEIGFISNPDEETLLNSDDYQNKCAEAIANAIMKNLKDQ